MTRKEYMENSDKNHEKYYQQYISKQVLEIIKSMKLDTTQKLSKFDQASNNLMFNDMELREKMKLNDDSPTLGGLVSLFKTACKIEERKETKEAKQITVSKIKWESDNMEDIKSLSTKMDVTVPASEFEGTTRNEEEEIISEYISNYISDKVGFTHKGFKINNKNLQTKNKVKNP